MFAEGAFSQAFVPILAEYQACARRRRDARSRRPRRARCSRVAAARIVRARHARRAVARLCCSPAASRDARQGRAHGASSIRIMFLYILFISLVSLAGGVLNVSSAVRDSRRSRRCCSTFRSSRAAIFVAPHCRSADHRARRGAFVGGVAQLMLQIVPLAQLGDAAAPALRLARRRRAPRAARRWGRRCSACPRRRSRSLINTQLAAYLGDGRISWITYADRLMEFPARCSASRWAIVLLPSLVQASSRREPRRSTRRCSTGACGSTFLLALPAALALALLARAVDRHAVTNTAASTRQRRLADARARCSATASACSG